MLHLTKVFQLVRKTPVNKIPKGFDQGYISYLHDELVADVAEFVTPAALGLEANFERLLRAKASNVLHDDTGRITDKSTRVDVPHPSLPKGWIKRIPTRHPIPTGASLWIDGQIYYNVGEGTQLVLDRAIHCDLMNGQMIPFALLRDPQADYGFAQLELEVPALIPARMGVDSELYQLGRWYVRRTTAYDLAHSMYRTTFDVFYKITILDPKLVF